MTLSFSVLLFVFILPCLGTALISFCREDAPHGEGAEQNLLFAMLALPAIGALTLIGFRMMPISPSAAPFFPEFAAGVGQRAEAGETVTGSPFSFGIVPVLALIIILGGAVLQLSRLYWSFGVVGRIVNRAAPTADDRIFMTSELFPPFSWRDRCVVLPKYLNLALSPPEIGLIVDHENEHIRRRDSRWFALLAMVDAIFWFNPFVRQQTTNCRQAAERAVDHCVISRHPEMRKAYAASLIMVLKHTAGTALHGVPAAIPPRTYGDTRMRIEQIMGKARPARKRRWTSAIIIPVMVAQVGLAAALIAPAAELVRVPTQGEVSSPFGKRSDPVNGKQKVHKGIDIKAAKGTEVVAAGAGTVTFAASKGAYGNLVIIDHGADTSTRYAQLDTVVVEVGDRVAAGEKIGTVGASGRATGPHLHFEVIVAGEHIDPASVLPL